MEDREEETSGGRGEGRRRWKTWPNLSDPARRWGRCWIGWREERDFGGGMKARREWSFPGVGGRKIEDGEECQEEGEARKLIVDFSQ